MQLCHLPSFYTNQSTSKMALTKVLITVKTYPTLSTKYEELVCTAGFREDGSWIRIYPIQFRKKPYNEQYSKYQWIEADLVKNEKDFRPESFRPASNDTEIKILETIKPDGDSWNERRKIVLRKVYHDLTKLISEAKDRSICTSLAVFKPTSISEFIIVADEREWDKNKLALLQQGNLFETGSAKNLEVVKKLPYKFSYRFVDEVGRESTLMIEDWELGQLYWNCLVRHNGDEEAACNDVRQKYFTDFSKNKDLHLFMGTTKEFHAKNAPNPFIIIGAFYPKPVTQMGLF
jgi:hypothetical protein